MARQTAGTAILLGDLLQLSYSHSQVINPLRRKASTSGSDNPIPIPLLPPLGDVLLEF